MSAHRGQASERNIWSVEFYLTWSGVKRTVFTVKHTAKATETGSVSRADCSRRGDRSKSLTF